MAGPTPRLSARGRRRQADRRATFAASLRKGGPGEAPAAAVADPEPEPVSEPAAEPEAEADDATSDDKS